MKLLPRFFVLILIASSAACEAEFSARVSTTPAEVAPVPAVSASASSEPAAEKGPVTKVVFRGTPPEWSWNVGGDRATFSGWAQLGGVDAERGLAYVAFHGADRKQADIRVLDFAHGTSRTWRRGGSDEVAESGALRGPELARLADLVASLHPEATRGNDWTSPHMAVSSSAIVYEDGHDALFIADRKGEHPRRLSTQLSAAYYAIFSPDEKRIAFTGCTQRGLVPKGAVHQCVYRLYLSDAPFKQLRAIDAVTAPTPPVWSADGQFVYAVRRDEDHAGSVADADRGGCLVRVDAASGEVHELHCTKEVRELGFFEAPDGASGVTFGLSRTGEAKTQLRAISLPDGEETSTASIPYATALEIGSGVGDDGLLLSEGNGALTAIDLASGLSASIPMSAEKRILAYGPWKNGHVVYALGTSAGKESPTIEVFEIDVHAILATNPKAGAAHAPKPAPDPDIPFY